MIMYSCGDETYTLEYTRETIRKLSRMGAVDLDAMKEKPVTFSLNCGEALFFAAFIKNHEHESQKKLKAIWDKESNQTSLAIELGVMAYGTLSPDEPEEGNPTKAWSVVKK